MRVMSMAVMAALLAAGAAGAEAPKIDAARYRHALNFTHGHADELVFNGTLSPHWRDGPREGFTYRKNLGDGRGRFVHVDAETGKASAAFDHARLAAALAQAMGEPVEADRLPFTDYEAAGPDGIWFEAADRRWTCDLDKGLCASAPAPGQDEMEVLSPDGRWAAFTRDNNLWVRPTAGGEAFALTTDGEAHYAYGAPPEGNSVAVPPSVSGKPLKPAVLWSPDSRHLMASKLDERQVREIGLFMSTPTDGTVRPRAATWRSAMPNDPAVPMEEPWVFDVAARSGHKVGVPAFPALLASSIGMSEARWADAGRLSIIARTRYYKTVTLYQVDANTGAARGLVSESGRTFVESGPFGQAPVSRLLKNGDVLWYSERSGHAQLYLYDNQGRLKRQVTDGRGAVSAVMWLDEDKGVLDVLAHDRDPGIDPYYDRLYRVGLSGGAMRLLTPEDAAHEIDSPLVRLAMMTPPSRPGETAEAKHSFSPSGSFFLDTVSRVDLPPRTVLRRADGAQVAEVERADISRLQVLNYPPAERFSTLAADGKTRLYGVIERPADFDPARRYPVLDSIYPGPQSRRVTDTYMAAMFDGFDARALADLGFVVVMVDGRGLPGRSKEFLDLSYGKLSEAGNLDDHEATIRELARDRPWMDLDRVGIYGFSGGGYASTHAMLTRPDFYKAAYSGSGSHDDRLYLAIWGETYDGPDATQDLIATANSRLAANLKGRLMLSHGEADYNVNPAHTMQLADALEKAGKDFELVLVPNLAHMQTPYVRRRSWDFLVRNLMGAEPPASEAATTAPPGH